MDKELIMPSFEYNYTNFYHLLSKYTNEDDNCELWPALAARQCATGEKRYSSVSYVLPLPDSQSISLRASVTYRALSYYKGMRW